MTAEAALGAYGIAFRDWDEGRSDDLHDAISAALDGLRTFDQPN